MSVLYRLCWDNPGMVHLKTSYVCSLSELHSGSVLCKLCAGATYIVHLETCCMTVVKKAKAVTIKAHQVTFMTVLRNHM